MARRRADLIRDRFGLVTDESLDPVTNVANVAPAVVLPLSPNRLAFTVINLSGAVVFLKPRNDVSPISAIRLAPAGGSVSVLWDEDFDLVGLEWWVCATVDASSILTLEVHAR
jgi:hypothetical protein